MEPFRFTPRIGDLVRTPAMGPTGVDVPPVVKARFNRVAVALPDDDALVEPREWERGTLPRAFAFVFAFAVFAFPGNDDRRLLGRLVGAGSPLLGLLRSWCCLLLLLVLLVMVGAVTSVDLRRRL